VKNQDSNNSSMEVISPENKQEYAKPETMKAIQIHEFGGVEKLMYESVPVPQPAPDEILIRVSAAGVNPIDWKIREGRRKDNIILPLILGLDVAGIVVGRGSLVTQFSEGDKVFARLEKNGAYAEYAVAKAAWTAYAPGIPLNIASGIPLASQTAWMGLFEVGGFKPGQKILIHGASGGVGTFAVQFAKIAGAYVIGTTSDTHRELVKSLGADEVIDYEKEDFRKKAKDLDMVFDTIGGETQERSWQVLRKGGILVSTVGVDENKATKFEVVGKSYMVNSNGARLQQIAGLVDKKMIRTIIEKEFNLEEVKKAHELSQSGKALGKIILRINANMEQS